MPSDQRGGAGAEVAEQEVSVVVKEEEVTAGDYGISRLRLKPHAKVG